MIKHVDLEIDKDFPFKNCQLDRQKYADVLTGIVENYSEGFVMAINNKWGTGKTTFVKMWQQELKNEGYQTIYFNAWENDFEDQPLTALIGELKTITQSNDETFKKVIKSAAKLSKNIAPALIKAVLNKYLDSEMLIETLTDSVKTGTEIFEQGINDYVEKKKSITDFRNNLSNFIGKNSDGKPLIFIIDELDRCRPNYAVSLLEQVKHFFTVPNIVFILSIDKEQLGNAICGVYGSDKIDSSEYLRRFIDIEYSIPEPKNGEFLKYLYEYFDFDSFFNSNERMRHSELKYDRDSFVSTSTLLLERCNLRQVEKILSTTRIALRTLNHNNFLMPVFFTFLIYIKFMHSIFYKELISKQLNLNDAHDKFFEIIKSFLNTENEWHFIQIEGLFLMFYQNYIVESRKRSDIYEYDKELQKNKLNINSKINNDSLLEYYSRNSRSFNTSFDLKLDYFTNRLDLTESIKIS